MSSCDDDDKDTYYEFFKREKELEEEGGGGGYEDNSTIIPPSSRSGGGGGGSGAPLALISSSTTPLHANNRHDLKHYTLYLKMLDMSSLFFQTVREYAVRASSMYSMTLEPTYQICLRDINNWKRDVIEDWKRKFVNRHTDIERVFSIAFKKFMNEYYNDEDMFDDNVTGYVGKKQTTPNPIPTLFYNVPDIGDFFHLHCVIMTKLPDVMSAAVLRNQSSLESCVSHALHETMYRLSQEVLRTIESREIIHRRTPSSSSFSVRKESGSSSSVRKESGPSSVRNGSGPSSVRKESGSSSSVRNGSRREKEELDLVRRVLEATQSRSSTAPTESAASASASASALASSASQEIVAVDDSRSISSKGVLKIRM